MLSFVQARPDACTTWPTDTHSEFYGLCNLYNLKMADKYFPKRGKRDNFNGKYRNATLFNPSATKPPIDTKDTPTKPMILIKREKETVEEVTRSPKHAPKENENAEIQIQQPPPKQPLRMENCVKFLDEGALCPDNVQEFLEENGEFLVIGVIGCQGVGKSTILNILAQNDIWDPNGKSVFSVGDQQHFECNSHATRGVDLFINKQRIFLLDTEPILSLSVLDQFMQNENRRSNILNEFIPIENSGEIYGLQLTAFLISICHILIVVQDYFLDLNVVRFLQTAEMLKPTHNSSEDELNDHYPHLLIVQNKATLTNFTLKQYQQMRETYADIFSKSKFIKGSNLGLDSSILHLETHNYSRTEYENPFDLFLMPLLDVEELTADLSSPTYKGRPSIQSLIEKFRANAFNFVKLSESHLKLTEKTWLIYCSKVWDTVRKSSYFVEYNKLMP